MNNPDKKPFQPIQITLEPGKKYSWCQCGKSSNQPFCDNLGHIGTSMLPKEFEVSKPRTAWLCSCKQTNSIPYCDGTHFKVNKEL